MWGLGIHTYYWEKSEDISLTKGWTMKHWNLGSYKSKKFMISQNRQKKSKR